MWSQIKSTSASRNWDTVLARKQKLVQGCKTCSGLNHRLRACSSPPQSLGQIFRFVLRKASTDVQGGSYLIMFPCHLINLPTDSITMQTPNRGRGVISCRGSCPSHFVIIQLTLLAQKHCDQLLWLARRWGPFLLYLHNWFGEKICKYFDLGHFPSVLSESLTV